MMRIKANHIITGAFLGFVFLLSFSTLLSDDWEVPVRDWLKSNSRSEGFEHELNESFPEKDLFVDVNGLIHRAFFQREMNDVVRLKNGHGFQCSPEFSEEGVTANADALKEFADWMEQEKNIEFFFLLVPLKHIEEDGQLPRGLVDLSIERGDCFLEKLEERNVRFLDLRQSIKEDGIDSYSLFLRTEHHWNPYGGFYAFVKICEYLENEFGEKVSPEVLDLDNYHQDTYKKYSLGYYGQRTGFLFSGLDDFTLIYPAFETKQSCYIVNKDMVREGSFYDAIIDQEMLELPWRQRGLYTIYIGGDYPLVIHHSETAENDKTVMIFVDSYGSLPESYLTTAFRDVVAVDLRWVLRSQWDISAVDFINEYSPDIVIVAFNPFQIGLADSEQFAYGL